MTHSNFDKDDLIIRYLAAETSAFENRTLSQWLNESPENKSYFNSIRNVWLASSQNVSSAQMNLSHDLNKRNIDAIETSEKSSSPDKTYLNWFLKVAAILMMLVISGVMLYKQLAPKKHSVTSNNVAVEATLGSRAITTLPDGTKVWLNSGSKIVYTSNYNNKTREVNLTGEAYFNVVTNPSKPFIVKTGRLSIKALGTIFNVKAYPEEASIITTLVKGKVVIEGKDQMNKEFIVQMAPKETVTYFKEKKTTNDNKEEGSSGQNHTKAYSETKDKNLEIAPITKIEQVKTELFTSWKDSRWVIEKQKLGDLARDFERRYNIKIQFSSENIKQFHFSGILENETIEQIMVIMRHTIPLNYRIEKGIINIGEDEMLIKKFYQ